MNIQAKNPQSDPLRALIVEDSENDAALLLKELERGRFTVKHRRVDDRAGMLDALQSAEWDVIVSDYSMPGFGGVEALNIFRASGLDIPFILVSGTVGEDVAVECMRQGAHDYLMKNRLSRLPEAIRRELREAEDRQRHRESAEMLTVVFDSAADGILLADAETRRFVRANRAMCRMLGYTREEVVNLSVGDIHPAESLRDVVAAFEKQQRGETTLVPHIPVKRKDGSVFLADINSSPLTLEDRPHLLGIFRDISVRLAREAQLRQSQKLESIGTLAGGVAHEINNPIMGIMNYAQLIIDKLGPDSPVSEYATEIGKETERVAAIVKNLLGFARHEKQSRSPARMHDIVEATLSLIRAVMRHDQVTLEVDVPEDLLRIKCRSRQIQQVIMNLLTNARDALNEKYEGFDENKKIRIAARAIDKDGRQWISTTVVDHGTGIPEDVRERMFDPFYTTKPRDKGTGLGLSISHGIVKDHGGALSVESEVGEFTRFHVDLPVDNGWKVE